MSVTLNNYGKMANMNTAEFYGKSTDEKPTEQNGGNIINGSIYVEIDTGRAYFYDAEMKMWTPVTPPSADGTYTKEQIDALLDKKMSYYIVTVDGNKIVHEGEVLTYAKIQQLYEDESVFIYMEHAGLTLIPSVDVDNSIIAFSSDWMRKEGAGYEPFIYVVQITSDNTVTSQQFQIEDAANKVTVINSRNATSEEKYPSVKAVVDYVDKDGINSEITDIKEDLKQLDKETKEDSDKIFLNSEYQSGKYLNFNGGYSNRETASVTDFIEISAGEKIVVAGYAGASAALIAFYSENVATSKIKVIVPETYGYYKSEFVAPEGANYYIASTFDNSGSYSARKYIGYNEVKDSISESKDAFFTANKALEGTERTENVFKYLGVNGENFINADIDGVIDDGLTGYYRSANAGFPPQFIPSETNGTIKVPVEAGERIIYYPYTAVSESLYPMYFNFVDEDGLCTERGTINDIGDNVFEITIPKNTKTLYLSYGKNQAEIKKVKLGYKTSGIEWLRLKTENFEENTIPKSSIIDDSYKYSDSINKPFEFYQKSIVSFGDSITYGVTSPNLRVGTPYIKHFADHVGATLNNKAVSGSCIADPEKSDSIFTRIMEYNGTPDFIFVAGGTNDFNTSKELGTFDSLDNTTFYGALKEICEHLAELNATVFFITPIPYTEAYWERHENLRSGNLLGYVLNDYRNAIYEIATLYNFNVVDGSTLGMPEEYGNWSNLMCDDSDGCHPSAEGHKLYARNLANKLI